jgi:hypothetical protein
VLVGVVLALLVRHLATPDAGRDPTHARVAVPVGSDGF